MTGACPAQPTAMILDNTTDTKKINPSADTPALRSEIDILVYLLYNLAPTEIQIVEEKQ